MNKFEKFNNEIKTYFRSEVVTNLSPSTSHRSRCEFSYYDNHYAMHGPNKKLLLKSFPLAASCIKKIMPRFCLLYTSPSPRDRFLSRMPSSA